MAIVVSLMIAGCHTVTAPDAGPEDKMIAGIADLDLSEQELRGVQEAASKGDLEACHRLFMYYEFVVNDFDVAEKFLRIAAEGGYALSQYWLGSKLIQKQGAYEEGVFWLKNARDAGYPEADNVLKLYEK